MPRSALRVAAPASEFASRPLARDRRSLLSQGGADTVVIHLLKMVRTEVMKMK